MARKTFKEGFKEEAVAYCKAHSDKTIKECANDLDLGYSTLRRWISQVEAENEAPKKAVVKEPKVKEVKTVEKEAPKVVEAPVVPKVEEKPVMTPVPIVTEATVAPSLMLEEEDEPSISYVPEFYKQKARAGQREERLANLFAFNKVGKKVTLISLYKKRFALKKQRKLIQKQIKNRIK